jgi:hypothetical protein
MKKLALTLGLFTLSLNAIAADAPAKGISPNSPEGKALVRAILASPAVRGALAEIKAATAKSGRSQCFPLQYELSTESFKLYASCNGSYGEDAEFSELATVSGTVYENGKGQGTVHVDEIKFDSAD